MVVEKERMNFPLPKCNPRPFVVYLLPYPQPFVNPPRAYPFPFDTKRIPKASPVTLRLILFPIEIPVPWPFLPISLTDIPLLL
jgi:hypothetical protein